MPYRYITRKYRGVFTGIQIAWYIRNKETAISTWTTGILMKTETTGMTTETTVETSITTDEAFKYYKV